MSTLEQLLVILLEAEITDLTSSPESLCFIVADPGSYCSSWWHLIVEYDYNLIV